MPSWVKGLTLQRETQACVILKVHIMMTETPAGSPSICNEEATRELYALYRNLTIGDYELGGFGEQS